MGLKKGTTNNPNGRPKGTENKINADIRTIFTNLLEKSIVQIEKDIISLSAKDRINAILKISEFVLPKLRTVEVETKFTNKKYIEYIKLKEEKDEMENKTLEELEEELATLRDYDD